MADKEQFHEPKTEEFTLDDYDNVHDSLIMAAHDRSFGESTDTLGAVDYYQLVGARAQWKLLYHDILRYKLRDEESEESLDYLKTTIREEAITYGKVNLETIEQLEMEYIQEQGGAQI